jgi:hypothetical protein
MSLTDERVPTPPRHGPRPGPPSRPAESPPPGPAARSPPRPACCRAPRRAPPQAHFDPPSVHPRPASELLQLLEICSTSRHNIATSPPRKLQSTSTKRNTLRDTLMSCLGCRAFRVPVPTRCKIRVLTRPGISKKTISMMSPALMRGRWRFESRIDAWALATRVPH